ncbi:SseB family protein [Falsarthrobacter nasiphocae]|uniref:SseB protein N-terminal domain-containing protein n=1 Tax=Falsarthrobacter nasiphocae TaxID=189863 RepID=A0AAE4C6K9_9MICC|nr:SseB family protein [Falsarthrobacter nasiphocae]MDR6892688.1 hypothetical protein [Falsarthrobacter nasiphocae]
MTGAERPGGEEARSLPGHIAAALERQKNRIAGGENVADTAGQPWAGRSFEHSRPLDPEDDGRADPAFASVLARWSAGEAEETEVARALPGVRLFVAVRADHAPDPGAQSSHPHDDAAAGDKAADMSICSLVAPDGRRALPVFTDSAFVAQWASDARPVPFDARRLALSCVQDGAALLVIDPGQDDGQFVLRRPAVWALAKGEEWTPAFDSADVSDALAACAAQFPEVAAIRPARGAGVDSTGPRGTRRGGGAGPELQCQVFVHSGLTAEAVARLMERVSQEIARSSIVAEKADSLSLRVLNAGPAA